MSEFFAEATVRLTPDLTGFVTQLRTDVKAAVERIEGTPAARVRIAPALTRNFVGDLRKQVNLAVAQAQKGVKPIVVRAVLSEVSRTAIAREIRSGAQTVRATTPVAAAPVAAAGAASTITAATTANQGFAASQKLVNALTTSGVVLLDQHMAAVAADAAATQAANADRAQGAKISNQVSAATHEETVATQLLAQAKQELAFANEFAAGSSRRARAIVEADTLAARARQAAIASGDVATQRSAETFRTQLRAVSGATDALNEHSRAAQRAASNMSQLRRGVLSTSLSFLGIRGATLAASARFLIAAAAVATFAKAIQSASATAAQLNVFRATTQATAVEMEAVAGLARELGADLSLPGVTALDAAEAMTELAKAGLSTQDAMDGARGVLQLATAAAIDNAQATELAANALNAFGLAGRDATRVADVFANAANAAQGSIVDMGIAFQQASAAGRQVGLSFEDTTTFLTVLARNGLRGSDAGTSLRTALIRLIKPTKEAAGELKRLGVETRDAAGNLRPDIFIQIAEATRGMAPAQRDATAALVGGQDAFRAITILGRQSIGDFIRLRRELRNQGTAADLAAARMSGLRGAVEGLGNTLSTIGLRAGQALTPALQSTVEGLSGTTAGLAASGEAAQLFGSSVLALEQSLAVLGASLSVIGTVALPLATSLAAITTSVGVPTLVAAAVAYLALSKAIALATAAMGSARIATLAVAAAMRPATFATAAFSVAARGLITALPLMQIAAAAAAAAIFYLVTRETAAEKATRKLKEATEELITAQERLRQSSDQRRDTRLQVSGAELGVFEARSAANAARSALANSNAGQGTFARTKLELQLAVALDNVKIAQNALADAQERSQQAREEAVQAAANEKAARQEEVESLVRLVATEQALSSIRRRGRGGASGTAAELSAIRNVNKEIEKRIQVAREQNTVESRALARRLELLQGVSAAVGRLPTDKAIDIVINSTSAQDALDDLVTEFGVTGPKAVAALRASVDGTLTGQLASAFRNLTNQMENLLAPPFQQMGNQSARHFSHAFVTEADLQAKNMAAALVKGLAREIKNLEGQATGLSVQENLAVIASGATGATLPVLQAQLANAQERERKARAAIAASEVGETPTLRKALRTAIADQARLTEAIRGINAQLASDAKAAQDEADQLIEDQKERQDKLFDAILEGMGIRRARRQERIEDAQLTEGVADNLRQTRILRRLAARQIQSIVDRIEQARKQGKNVEVLVEGLRVLRGIWRDLGREVRALQKTRLEEIQARAAESNQLDIAFAETTGNRAAEIRARRREIERLKRLQSEYKAGTVEYKRLRNLIAEQEKAIAEATTATKSLFAELSFNFLTTQQGFAANVFGNLIPGGVFGSTVAGKLAGAAGASAAAATSAASNLGGGTGRFQGRPGMGGDNTFPFGGAKGGGGRGIAAAAVSAGAGVVAPPTRGQHSTTNQLLNQILQVLRHSDAGTRHPSSKKEQKKTNAALDTHH